MNVFSPRVGIDIDPHVFGLPRRLRIMAVWGNFVSYQGGFNEIFGV
jgi:hypothetical protein